MSALSAKQRSQRFKASSTDLLGRLGTQDALVKVAMVC